MAWKASEMAAIKCKAVIAVMLDCVAGELTTATGGTISAIASQIPASLENQANSPTWPLFAMCLTQALHRDS